jgi:hypothetical protein
VTSLTGRYVPPNQAIRVINSFVRDHRDGPHPIHEVDAHVLTGRIFNLAEAARHGDLPVSLAAQAAMSKKLDGRCWIMVCHDSMSGSRPVATVHVNAQMNMSERGIHLVLTIADIICIGANRPLPYRLERVLVRGIADSFWAPVDQAEIPPLQPQSLCA